MFAAEVIYAAEETPVAAGKEMAGMHSNGRLRRVTTIAVVLCAVLGAAGAAAAPAERGDGVGQTLPWQDWSWIEKGWDWLRDLLRPERVESRAAAGPHPGESHPAAKVLTWCPAGGASSSSGDDHCGNSLDPDG